MCKCSNSGKISKVLLMLLLNTGLRLIQTLTVGLSCTPVKCFCSIYHTVQTGFWIQSYRQWCAVVCDLKTS